MDDTHTHTNPTPAATCGQTRQDRSHGVDFVCELPAGHGGVHRETLQGYTATWADGLAITTHPPAGAVPAATCTAHRLSLTLGIVDKCEREPGHPGSHLATRADGTVAMWRDGDRVHGQVRYPDCDHGKTVPRGTPTDKTDAALSRVLAAVDAALEDLNR